MNLYMWLLETEYCGYGAITVVAPTEDEARERAKAKISFPKWDERAQRESCEDAERRPDGVVPLDEGVVLVYDEYR